ncbi:MAG TPA: thiamine pyrophosphokinase [Daejeonella sp.]|nr:thiamine pyrophosphokinase [Daejeonella sp.]
MSSHHIVREKQEPALLIMDLQDFPLENLGQLLEWSPTIIVAEEMYEHTESLGIKIDAVLSSTPNFAAQEHTHVILSGDNPLEDALKYLSGEHYQAVNIITHNFVLKDYALYVDDINMVIFTPHKKTYAVRSGFSKWQTRGEQLELAHPVHNLKVSGLYYLTDEILETEKDGFFCLKFEQPFIFISELT